MYWSKQNQRWQAQVAISGGRCKYLGSFVTPRAAAKARDAYIRKHRKDFAVTNGRADIRQLDQLMRPQ